jgi:hypothetical protein
MKKCAYCGQRRPLDSFYQVKPGKYSARCKACHGIAVRSCVQCGVPFVGQSGAKLGSAECRQAYRPRTHQACASCGVLFPVAHLRRRFCCYRCKVKAQTTGRKIRRVTCPKARKAPSLLRYHVRVGHLLRPTACEACGATAARIEGAHDNDEEPLPVRWLCVSCHRRWDRREPKGATYAVRLGPDRSGEASCHTVLARTRIVQGFEQFTGQKAERLPT